MTQIMFNDIAFLPDDNNLGKTLGTTVKFWSEI